MSYTGDVHFVQQYAANIDLLMQQRGSKLEDAVRIEMQTGEYAYYDQLSKQTSLTESPDRNASTTYQDSPFVRRRVGLTSYKYAELIDKSDEVKYLTSPENTIARNIAHLFGRTKDSVILTAASGIAYTGKAGATETSFTAAMVIPSSGTVGVDTNAAWCGDTSGLNEVKLIGGNYLLDNQDCDQDDRFLIAHPYRKADLLQLQKVTSGDYANKALMTNQLDEYLGLKIVWTTQIPSTVAYIWHKSAMLLSIGADDLGFRARIEEDQTHWYSTQVTNWMDIGATRMDETAIVQLNLV